MLVNGLKTYILDYGEGQDVVLLLHGWGGNSASMLGLGNELSLRHRVIIPDLWGWGQSQHPPENFGIYDYAEHIVKLLSQLDIERVVVIGHSFGGRIGIILSSLYPHLISKLVLIDSAGLKPRFSLIKHLKVKRYKRLKKQVQCGIKDKSVLSKFGSSDYLSLDQDMQKVFVRVVNQHLNSLACDITHPTLIIWGKHDKQTPLYMAKVLHKMIKSSKIILLKGGHFAYLTEQSKAIKSIFEFLEES